MRKLFAWLGVATLFVLTSSAHAQNDVLKPYVVLILDTSGSMDTSTGSGPTSCGKTDNRINHAVCAIYNIVNSYGDMVFSLAKFRETASGTPNDSFCTTGCSTVGPVCADCNPGTGTVKTCSSGGNCTSGVCRSGVCSTNQTCTSGSTCASGVCNSGFCTSQYSCTTNDNVFQLMTALVDGTNTTTATFVDRTCNTCNPASTGMNVDPEIWGVGGSTFTPLAATLYGDKRYWQGLRATDNSTIWPENAAGFDPINRDPTSAVFLARGQEQECNPNPTTCTLEANMAESACTGVADDDTDGRVNDGCPQQGGAPETLCADTIDNDNDGRTNDGCPTFGGPNGCCIEQCRPYVTILLTDGDETCTAFSNTTDAATQLLTTTPRSDAVGIQSVVRSNNTVTLTTLSAHPFAVGDAIIVTGVSNSTFNNTTTVPTFKVLTVNGNQITYTQPPPALSNTTSSMGDVRHAASTYRYRIETKPIGFGIAPGDPDIEAIAHAGGAIDLPNINEGYYANDEADLELAISQILADSVRSESCNDRDDDCDTRIDEDFPTKGNSCTNGLLGECAATGQLECQPDGTLSCNAPDISGVPEGTVCDGKDNNCNGLVDEGLGCTTCVPKGEICNNEDDDCDTKTDEGLTRSCGQGTCLGVEICTAGTWGGCTAQPSTDEICDGLDNNCDGVCDGQQTGCSEVNVTCNPNNPTSCPATDNPGDPGHYPGPDAGETACNDAIDNDLDGFVNDGCPTVGTAETTCNDAVDSDGDNSINDGCPVPALPIAQNICHPGSRVCPQLCSNNGNSYGMCSGEVKPLATDPCNGLDDDCDNKIDEDFTPADCSTNCGVGQTKCVNGNVTCDSTPAGNDTTCNNVDDDCDGKIDENWTCANPVNGKCPCGAGIVCNGEEKCINGQVQCQGGPLGTETCNCLDDDCDGEVDEDPDPNDPDTNICPGGATCVNCQCAFGCAQGEFPCPLGKKCEDNYCVNDPCYGVTCPPVNGHAQQCIPKPGNENEPQCIDICSTTTCSTNFVCYEPTGECRPDDCTTFPERCTTGQVCIVGSNGFGSCVSNPCQGVDCPADKYCIGGTCVSSCADVTCPSGQRCRQGVCETDPCGHACPFGYACNDVSGECIEDPCKFRDCPQGQWCNPNDGQCEDDPCVANAIECPNEGEVCRGGTCLDQDDLRPDAAGATHVTVGGGGGCSTSRDSGAASSLLLGLALLVTRRRRRVRAAQNGGAQ